ncbi:MAG: transposase [Armatimonadota bacterium]|nr:transposase [Armatimonadota bacterium]
MVVAQSSGGAGLRPSPVVVSAIGPQSSAISHQSSATVDGGRCSVVWRGWSPSQPGSSGRSTVRRRRLEGRCTVTDWPPQEVFPGRRRPHRLPRCEYQKLLQPVFFAACTRNRRRVLLHGGLPRILRALLDSTARGHGCEIIAYTIMPDHLHVLACVVREGGDTLPFFKEFKRSAAHAAMAMELDRLWQRDFWDRHTRNDHDLRKCVTYILWNAVEEGLCERPEEWPYAAFRGWPWSLLERAANAGNRPTND